MFFVFFLIYIFEGKWRVLWANIRAQKKSVALQWIWGREHMGPALLTDLQERGGCWTLDLVNHCSRMEQQGSHSLSLLIVSQLLEAKLYFV